MAVRIPSKAVAVDPPNDDITPPVQELLQALNLLPNAEQLKSANGLGAAFTGPPDSVAIIEAGATAASKWWAGGIAAAAAGWVGQAAVLWEGLGEDNSWNQPFTILSIGLVLSAAVVGIGYLLGSDVRGRAAAMVATVEARRDVATTMVQEAAKAFDAKEVSPTAIPIALSGMVAVLNGTKLGAAEQGWRAIATREIDGLTQFLLVKSTQHEWVDAPNVDFT